jgi:predicted dehydrogenase
MVGFNYLKNPIARLARDMVAAGEIGEVIGYRGWHFEDYMHDPNTLVSQWRLDPANGDGVSSDLGSHAVSMARFLVGDIVEVSAQRRTVVARRPTSDGRSVPVEVPDVMGALVRFSSGATGSIEASWMAAGSKHTIAAEVWGSAGSLAFDFERLNELRWYRPGQPTGREGVTTILAGPSLEDYAAFVPAPGHQLGFNDLKTIEVRDLLEGLDPSRSAPWPDFREAWEVQRVLDAAVRSDQERRWVLVSEV